MGLDELNRHFELRRKLERAQEILNALRSAACPGAAKITGMPHAPEVKDPVGDLAVEIADMTRRIEALTGEISNQETEIQHFIEAIEDDQTRMVFRLRFLRGLSWKEVSSAMGRYTTEKSVSDTCYKYFKRKAGGRGHDA